MPRQLSCRGMCKIVTWLDHYCALIRTKLILTRFGSWALKLFARWVPDCCDLAVAVFNFFPTELFWIFIDFCLQSLPSWRILTHWGQDKMAAIFPDDIFKWIFLNENVWISINISLNFVPRGPINNIPTLVQVMAWRRPGDKPLSEPMMVSLPTHICVYRRIYASLGINELTVLHSWLRARLWYLQMSSQWRCCSLAQSHWCSVEYDRVDGLVKDCSIFIVDSLEII